MLPELHAPWGARKPQGIHANVLWDLLPIACVHVLNQDLSGIVVHTTAFHFIRQSSLALVNPNAKYSSPKKFPKKCGSDIYIFKSTAYGNSRRKAP